MTTIVGLHIPGRGTWIGSDRQATTGGLKVHNVDKWVRHGDWAVGVSGFMLALNLVSENAPALLTKLQSPRMFVNRFRKLMLENHITPERGDADGEGGLEFWNHNLLLASPEGLWEISSEMVCHAVRPGTLWAAGSGQSYALGAGLAANVLSGGDPEKTVEMAVKAALQYDIASGGEPFFDHLKPAVKAVTGRRKKAVA